MLRVTLKVVGGEFDSGEIQLQLPAIIGRGRDLGVNLSHPLVSRRHCELRESHGELRVRDLGSLNGTFVGSERVVDAVLRPGDLLTVGTVTFRAIYEPINGVVAERSDAPVDSAETQRSPAETVRVDTPLDRPVGPHSAAHLESPR